MNPPARRLCIWFYDPQPSRRVRINHTLARLSRPAEAVVKPQPQRAHPPPAAIAAGAQKRRPVAPHYEPGKRSRTNAKAQRCKDARTSAAGHHHLPGESSRPVFPSSSPCNPSVTAEARLVECARPRAQQAPNSPEAPDFIASPLLSNIAAPEDGRTPPRHSPAVTDPLHPPIPCAFASWRLCVNFPF